MNNSEFKYTKICSAKECRFNLSGSIVGGESLEAFDVEIKKVIEDRVEDIVLNFWQVNYVNSSGIGLILRMHLRAEKVNVKIRLINLNEEVKKIFEVARLNTVLRIESV
jgi:anti-anti-sigma factor